MLEFLIGVVLLSDFSELLQLEVVMLCCNYGSNVGIAKAFLVIKGLALP